MNYIDIVMLARAGYTRDEIEQMRAKKDPTEEPKKDPTEEPKDPTEEPKKDPTEEPKEISFDYDKLASAMIAKMQESNRRTNVEPKQMNLFDELNKLL